MHRRFGGSLAIVGLHLALAACDDQPVAIPEDTYSGFAAGRSFATRARMSLETDGELTDTGGHWIDRRVTVSSSDPVWVDLYDFIKTNHCLPEAWARFDPTNSDPTPEPYPSYACDGWAVYRQWIDMCVGYAFQTLAEATTATSVYTDGRLEPESTDPSTVRESLEDDTDLVMRIPAPNASDAATLALVALTAFQTTASEGAYALGPNCTGNVSYPFPWERSDTGGWRTTGPHVTTGELLILGTAEAVDRLKEVSDQVRDYINAAADARLSDDRDTTRALTQHWRAEHDSRLEVANIIFGVPARLFDNAAELNVGMLNDGGFDAGVDGAVDGGGPDASIPASALPYVAGYPVCSSHAVDLGEKRAEDLMRELQIDVGFQETDLPLGDLLERIRDALVERHAQVFDPEMMSPDPAAFLTDLGLTPDVVARAARRLREESVVLGREIVPSQTPGRVRAGTARPTAPPNSAFLMATSQGSTNRDDGDDGGMVDHDEALYSVLATMDFVSSVLPAAYDRPSLVDNAKPLIRNLQLFLREMITHRAQLCTGHATTTEGGEVTLETFRVRLYGVEPDINEAQADEIYELWYGESGLQCAVNGNIEGVPCDRERARIDVAPTFDDEDTDLGTRYLEWLVDADDIQTLWVGETSRPLRGTTHIYITRRSSGAEAGSRVEAMAGFTLRPGANTGGEWSRCTLYPLGPLLLDELGGILAPSPDECEHPQTTCAGLPRDIRIPLEDELTEAAEGRDGIESSFFHYLRIARQAADEADRLGEQLIEQGTQMDMRAEAAADRLQDICGGVVNVNELPRETLDACDDNDDCEDGVECQHGFCAGTLTDLLQAPGYENSSLQSCLGTAQTTTVAASLGSQPLCVFRRGNGALCECAEGSTCPECPLVGVRNCSEEYSMLGEGYTVFETRALSLTNDTVTSNAPMANCADLARLRSRVRIEGTPPAPDAELFNSVVSGAWLDMPTFTALASSLEYRDEMARFATVLQGGAPWISTGSIQTGPVPEGTFPCGAEGRLGLDEWADLCSGIVAAPRMGYSLLCGSACNTIAARNAYAHRLAVAVGTVARLGGVDVQPLSLWERGTSLDSPVSGREFNSPFLDEAVGEGGQIVDHQQTSGSNTLFSTCLNPVSGFIVGTVAERALWNACDPIQGCTPPDDCHCDPFESGHCPGAQFRRVQVGSLTGTGYGFRRESAVAAWDPLVDLRVYDVDVATTSTPGIDGFLADVYGGRLGPGEGATAFGSRDIPAARVYTVVQRRPDADPRDVGMLVTNAAVFDALELACLARQDQAGGGCSSVSVVPDQLRSAEDFERLGGSLACAARQLEARASKLTLADMPSNLADDIASASVAPTYPRNRGQYGETVAELRSSLEDISGSTRRIASILRDFSLELRNARSQMTTTELEDQLAELTTLSQISSSVASCAASAGGLNFGSAAVCADAIVQIVIAFQTRDLRTMTNEQERVRIRTDLALRFGSRMDALEETARNLSQAYARTNGLLAQLDRLRNEARREAARVLFLDRDEVGQEYAVNRVMRARLSTLRHRYDRARRRAVQMAYLARRAVEQRLGVDLTRMRDEMTLVPAPATWADSVCSMSGIDYDRIRDVGDDVTSYDEGYVGNYVTLLEDFIESYRLDYPFQDGRDVAVLSLRDDLHHVREACDVRGHNLLRSSDDLSDRDVWHHGCDSEGFCAMAMTEDREPDDPDGGTSGLAGPFQSIDRVPDGGALSAPSARALGGSAAVRLEWGELPDGGTPGEAAAAPGISQSMTLSPGLFALSWYERVGDSPDGGIATPQAVLATQADTALEMEEPDPAIFIDDEDRWRHPGWRRAWTRFSNPVEQTVTITFAPPGTPSGMDMPDPVVISAPQLEAVSPDVAGLDPPAEPEPYLTTNSEGVAQGVGLCEDSDGSSFRDPRYWTRACEYVCPDGFGATCGTQDTPDRALLRCFWESRFTMSLPDIERGDVVPTGALALGNFNYRIGLLAINVVGTGVRDCSRSPNPSACYGSGFIPFSLQHAPPFRVRNHAGEVIDAPLFSGNIEQAKALLAERYITNPISSADRSLLTDYQRGEFEGRPLEGSYRLRIWDAPGFDWNRVEDVQIVLDYRYWTRFE
ncbi:MAG: hypothetical protein IT379_31250 [Deltaproteobacteria bacterium]|nr:hypothetical protein [Deltaproteobacteria bacterium]